jgi:uncharacterized membrane protein YecN with MAPEG domain
MSFAITGVYASLLCLLMIFLGVRVSLARGRSGVSILTGDSKELSEWVRRHANLTETVPMALILMAINEAQGAGALTMHATGLILLAGRLAHPLGIHFDKPNDILRAGGMSLTLIAMLIPVAMILWRSFA